MVRTNEWLVTIYAGTATGWVYVPKSEARTKKRAERWVEDMLCAAGPDFVSWDVAMSVDDLTELLENEGWDVRCTIDADRYPETVATLEVMAQIDQALAA